MKLASMARAALVVTLLLPAALLAPACAPVSAPYNPVAQNTTTALKAETLALLDTAGDPYVRHTAEIAVVTAKIDAAAQAAAAKPQNSLAARQWSVLSDPNRALYGGTIALWRTQGTLSPTFRDQKKIQIGRAFDYILCLEANKQQARTCGDLEGGA